MREIKTNEDLASLDIYVSLKKIKTTNYGQENGIVARWQGSYMVFLVVKV